MRFGVRGMDRRIYEDPRMGSGDAPRLRTREFRAMGSQMMAAVQTNAPMAGLLLERVPARFEGWEQQLSRFRPDSELNQLNLAAGQLVAVSPELWEVLEIALDAAR